MHSGRTHAMIDLHTRQVMAALCTFGCFMKYNLNAGVMMAAMVHTMWVLDLGAGRHSRLRSTCPPAVWRAAAGPAGPCAPRPSPPPVYAHAPIMTLFKAQCNVTVGSDESLSMEIRTTAEEQALACLVTLLCSSPLPLSKATDGTPRRWGQLRRHRALKGEP